MSGERRCRSEGRRPDLGLGGGAPVLALLLSACGGIDGPAPGTGPISFSGEAAATATTAAQGLRVDVRWSPQPPVRGSDAAEFTIVGADLATAALTFAVVPWMPAHGHGTAVQPVVTEMSPGVFVATPLYLYMPGHWELRMTVGGAGADDTATVAVDIP